MFTRDFNESAISNAVTAGFKATPDPRPNSGWESLDHTFVLKPKEPNQ